MLTLRAEAAEVGERERRGRESLAAEAAARFRPRRGSVCAAASAGGSCSSGGDAGEVGAEGGAAGAEDGVGPGAAAGGSGWGGCACAGGGGSRPGLRSPPPSCPPFSSPPPRPSPLLLPPARRGVGKVHLADVVGDAQRGERGAGLGVGREAHRALLCRGVSCRGCCGGGRAAPGGQPDDHVARREANPVRGVEKGGDCLCLCL